MNNTMATIFITVFASTGFWTVVNTLIQKHDRRLNNRDKLLIGIAYDRICYLGEHYIHKGYITRANFENLHTHLYAPYKSLCGEDGTVEKVMRDVEKLPIRED